MQFYLFIFLSKLLESLLSWKEALSLFLFGAILHPAVFKRMGLGWILWQIAINCELTALHSLREGRRPKPSSCSLQPFPSSCAGSLEVHFSAASEGIASYSWSHALFLQAAFPHLPCAFLLFWPRELLALKWMTCVSCTLKECSWGTVLT